MAEREDPAEVGEARLVERARSGDGPAFAELVRRHQSRVRVLFAFHLPDRSLVDDVVQDVFLTAFRRLDAFRGESSFGTWLATIARRRLLELIRQEARLRGKHRRSVDAALEEGRLSFIEEAADEPLVGDRALAALRDCVSALPAASHTLVEQHYFRSRSLVSIAAELGRNESSLRSTLMRIRQALRQCVSRRLAGEGA